MKSISSTPYITLGIGVTLFFCLNLKLYHASILSENNKNGKFEVGNARSGKFLKIVTVEPNACAGETDMGVCKSRNSCSKLNGSDLGTSCGMFGVGVCCLPTFMPIQEDVPIIINEKVSLIKPNNNFIASDFRFPKLNDSCQIRVDFRPSLNYKGPTNGFCEEDKFQIEGSVTIKPTTLCGSLMEPLYLAYSTTGSEPIKLKFNSKNKTPFEIKVTHIDCNSPQRVGDHCLLNLKGDSGTVTSFGYNSSSGARYQINNLEYNICVGRPGSKLNWEMCFTDSTNQDMTTNMNSFYTTHFFGNYGGREQTCVGKTSYVGIPGVGSFCGGHFPKIVEAPMNILYVKTVVDDLTRYSSVQTTEFFPINVDEKTTGPIECDANVSTGVEGPATIFASGGCVNANKNIKYYCTCNPIKPNGNTAKARNELWGFCLQYNSNQRQN